MAEAIVNHMLGDRWEAFSAGTEPRGVNGLTVQVLHDMGIEIPTARSKHVDEFIGQQFDRVVTLCDDARESCPVLPGAGKPEHFALPDPAAVEGNTEKKLRAFRNIRDKIREIIVIELLK